MVIEKNDFEINLGVWLRKEKCGFQMVKDQGLEGEEEEATE